jgi:hypothetical protein
MDPCGANLPLKWAPVDRLEPTLGYEPGNERLLMGPLNVIRGTCKTDCHDRIRSWLSLVVLCITFQLWCES